MKRLVNTLTFKIGILIVLTEVVVLTLISTYYFHRVSDVLDEKDELRALQVGPDTGLASIEETALAVLTGDPMPVPGQQPSAMPPQQGAGRQLPDHTAQAGGEVLPDSPLGNPGQPLAEQLPPGQLNAADAEGQIRPPREDDTEVFVIEANGTLSSPFQFIGVAMRDVAQIDNTLIDFEHPTETLIHVQVNEDHFIHSVRPVFNDDGTVASFVYVQMNTNNTEETKLALIHILTSGSLLTILVTSLLLFVGIRIEILLPLQTVLQALSKIEAGDMSARITGTSRFPDEMDTLQQGINATTDQLETLFNTLEQQVSDRTRDVQIAMDVSRNIVTILDLDELLQQVVSQVNRHFDFYASFIYLEEAGALVRAAGADAQGKALALDDYPALDLATTPDTISVARTAHTRAMVLANDLSAETPAIQSQLPETRSRVILPIMRGQQLLGVFDVQSTQAGYFGPGEVSILNMLAEQIAIAIQNAQSFTAANNARQAAEAANRAKSVFLANMSHELRTPLNAILGFAQLMERDPQTLPEHQENLGVINRSGEHLLQLINDVLEMSKIEAGRTELHSEAFNLHQMLTNLEEMLLIKAENKGLQFQVERLPDVPPYITTDEAKLRQVLVNLIGNAIKFTQEGGITVRVDYMAADETPQLCFEVEDTGEGIAEDELDQLFEVFAQTASGHKSQEGTGLGLPISRQFVRLMGGDLTVQSAVGQGTLITFAIDVTLAEAADVAADVAAERPEKRILGLAQGQPIYRILIVDDKWANRALLHKLLQPLGFDVREAENGQVAVDMYEDWHPHLIFMDMRMPVMDGYEATRRIKASTEGQAVAIIALTASVFEHERVHILSNGCDDFMRKPFRQQVLFEKLVEHLGIEFIYEDQVAADNAASTAQADFELTAEALQALPAAWRNSLHEAVSAAQFDKALHLLDEQQTDHPLIVQALTELVNTFRFKVIIDLLDTPSGD